MKQTTSLLLLLFSMVSFACAKKNTQPNVLVIFPDQFRQYSLGFWSQDNNSQYIHGNPDPTHTPHIDALAKQGIVFSNSISNFPLCSPYRGMMLTGRYPYSNGLTANCRADREVEVVMDGNSIADVFSRAGYNTAYFGKCHWVKTEPVFDKNGVYKGTTEAPGGNYINRYDTYVPPGKSRLGFEYYMQTMGDTHFTPRCYSNDPSLVNGNPDGEPYQVEQFSAGFEAEALLAYLDNKAGKRNEEKPFFAVWSLNPPHNPWDEKNTEMEYFSQYGKQKLDNLLKRGNADQTVGAYAPYYFANVSAVDHYIGLILEKLETLGLDDKTIVVFTSDHGEMLGSHGHQGKPYPESEAFGIPLIMKWGDKLEHRVDDMLFSVPDLMPTLLGLAGLEETIPSVVQGSCYANRLLQSSGNKAQQPTSSLYIDYKSRGIYTGQYTFVVTSENDIDCTDAFYYDNKKDPYQMHRIKGDEMDKDLLETFKQELVKQLVVVDDLWAQNHICANYLNYNIVTR